MRRCVVYIPRRTGKTKLVANLEWLARQERKESQMIRIDDPRTAHFEVFFNTRRDEWGVRLVIDGDCKMITFHRNLLFLLAKFSVPDGQFLPVKKAV